MYPMTDDNHAIAESLDVTAQCFASVPFETLIPIKSGVWRFFKPILAPGAMRAWHRKCQDIRRIGTGRPSHDAVRRIAPFRKQSFGNDLRPLVSQIFHGQARDLLNRS